MNDATTTAVVAHCDPWVTTDKNLEQAKKKYDLVKFIIQKHL